MNPELNNPEQSALGKKSAYISEYTPQLLFPIPRQLKRNEIGIDNTNLPFYGVDIWNHYEVSWLNLKGKPQVALATIEIPATSPNIIESKSMKLYFNGFNNYKLKNKEELTAIIVQDLSNAVGIIPGHLQESIEAPFSSKIKVNLIELDSWFKQDNDTINKPFALNAPHGICIDNLDIEINQYNINPDLLKVNPANLVHEQLYSNLLKSNCPVTNQPDWATIIIDYSGPAIIHESLLEYIISFRNHNEFHEQCVERIFNDIMQICKPTGLMVSARFTRRGGIDINPVRSTESLITTDNLRLIRQ